jgi:hypothetical protein
MASRNTTRITVQAVLTGVKATLQKAPEGYGKAKPGAMEVTFRIDQPAPPVKPEIPSWHLASHPRPENLGERPEEVDPKEWKREIAAVQKWQKEWDERHAEHEMDMVRYAAALEAFRPSLMAFAQLSGLAMVMGNQRINLEMSPADTDFLPGFELALPAPSESGE